MKSGEDETLKIHSLTVVEDELVTTIDEGHAITCPFCGSVVVTIADGCVRPPCQHTQFIFINGEGFEYAEPGLEAWLKEQEERADEDCCGFDVMERSPDLRRTRRHHFGAYRSRRGQPPDQAHHMGRYQRESSNSELDWLKGNHAARALLRL